MNRQLIICCDGTNNNLTGRRNDTHVAQLCELLAPDSQKQLLYYDPGVGNAGELPEANPWDHLKQKMVRLSGLAYGSGIYENIATAYRFLMHHWQPGDEIFLYGFSRGAFTARSVGGLVTQFGILRPEMDVMLPTLLHFYFLDRDKYEDSYLHIKTQISELFASKPARTAPVWFVGVWDTVASVGAPFISREIPATPTIVDKRYHHVRQALALDEYRTTFKPRPYFIEAGYDYAAHQQSIKQQWFAGAHGDVGGGYLNAEAGLALQTLLWMARESVQCGLRLRPDLLDAQGQPDTAALTRLLTARSRLMAPRQKLVHAALYDSALWALGGMTVRNPHATEGLIGMRRMQNHQEMPPQESPTVEADHLQFPASTVWRGARPWGLLCTAAVLGFLCWVVAGALLLGPDRMAGPAWWSQLAAALRKLPAVWAISTDFAQWQLAWWWQDQAPTATLGAFHRPAAAVLLGFGLIAAYATLLAHTISWAFARVAGLRRVRLAVPVMLNRLGLAVCVALVGAVAENIATLALLATSPNPFIPGLEFVLGVAMSLAALAKWVGLAGCGLLVAWGCAARPQNT